MPKKIMFQNTATAGHEVARVPVKPVGLNAQNDYNTFAHETKAEGPVPSLLTYQSEAEHGISTADSPDIWHELH